MTHPLKFEKKDYLAASSTLCKGCGHDAITSSVAAAMYDLSINPQNVIKVSGIGCSSKTPTYFSKYSFGFNSLHGRMAPLATGVHLSQPSAKLIGVSGDGDTASIGLGGFLHLIRRNVPMVYIIADNGVYGLTKGQFSATSHKGDLSKLKDVQTLQPMDPLYQAFAAGCGFVARAFSGDQVQLKTLLKLAFSHPGTALLNVISPCVAYGNHTEFSKSYTHAQNTNHPLHQIDLLEGGDATTEAELKYTLSPVEGLNHNPLDYNQTLELFSKEHHQPEQLHTGLLFHNPNVEPFAKRLQLSMKDKHLADLNELRLSPEKFHSLLEDTTL